MMRFTTNNHNYKIFIVKNKMKKVQITEKQLKDLIDRMSINELDKRTYQSAADKLDKLGHDTRASELRKYSYKLGSLGEFEMKDTYDFEKKTFDFMGFDFWLTVDNFFENDDVLEGEKYPRFIKIFPFFNYGKEQVIPFIFNVSLLGGLKVVDGWFLDSGYNSRFKFTNRKDAMRFIKLYNDNLISEFKQSEQSYRNNEYYSNDGIDFIIDLLNMSKILIKPNFLYQEFSK